MPKPLAYTILDVFAERALEGNPLAVFHDGRGLATEQMQALARETNLSETTFVLPDESPERDRTEGVAMRIFTTQEELPFAGHPTLGTATWLRLNHPALRDAAAVTLRQKAGPITVRFQPAQQGADGLYGTMRQRDPSFGEEFDPREVAALLGIDPEAMLPGSKPQSVSTGNAFCITALRSPEALQQLQIPHREATVWLRDRGVRWFYCIAPEAPSRWRARMQWENGEDPATGSAAGPCIAWLVRTGLAEPGARTTLLQGVEIFRPSRLEVQASRNDAGICEVEVGGRTIPVAAGQFLGPL